ncbi:MAG: CarD family transcriptional regulator, partial [Ruminiclostridium sp.]|nr:CarD family transcriptional regulator [Ruminiclostridium sp.]
MTENYRSGDYVSYSCNGVCRIDGIRQETTDKGPPKTFYILKPVTDPSSTIFVPTHSPLLLAKMKPLPSKEEVDALILASREEEMPWIEDRKLRAATFQTILKACNLKDLLGLVTCIYRKGCDLT